MAGNGMREWFANKSVRTKVNTVLLAVLLTVMVFSMLFTVRSERAMVEQTVLQNIHDTTDSYLDTLNIMMLTGTLAIYREVHREKVLSQPGMTEARVLRTQHVRQFYGPGQDIDQPRDELDERALQGEAIDIIRDTPEGRILTVLRPVINDTDYRGTNCTTCHTGQGGEQLGVIRLSYSLDELDKRINMNLLQLGGIQLALFIGGIFLISLVFLRVILNPLAKLRKAMNRVEEHSDLTVRVDDIHSTDEIGTLSSNFNTMLERFAGTMQQVASTTRTLKQSANTIATVAEETVNAVNAQYQETDQMASAIEEMQASAKETSNHASYTLQASAEADEEASSSRLLTKESIQNIHELTAHLEKASGVIKDVDRYSEDVGKVLDIITSIAEQTNLLALNAAIEAARAGETGRGFAVVADEVRSLANRTHEATQDVQRTIQRLQNEAHGAVSVMATAHEGARKSVTDVDRVSDSLNNIADVVNRINSLNAQMSTAAQEQQDVAARVNSQVSHIALIAERTSSDATKSTQVSDDLVKLANHLETLVNSFKLD